MGYFKIIVRCISMMAIAMMLIGCQSAQQLAKDLNAPSQSTQVVTNAPDFGAMPYRISHVIWEDHFQSLDNWIPEQQPGGHFKVADHSLTVTDAAGCTIWYKHRLTAPVMIEYTAAVDSTGRVSDLNTFWMAAEANGSCPFVLSGNGKAAPKRTGRFSDYHPLKLYYVGCGGNTNTTTRFRRYPGTGERPMNPEHDLTDARYLLAANHPYRIRIVLWNNRVQYWRDGTCFFDIIDREPIQSGWFAFRMVNTTQQFQDFRVYRIHAQ